MGVGNELAMAVAAALTGATVGEVVERVKDLPGVLVAQSAGGCPQDVPPSYLSLVRNELGEVDLELYVGDRLTVVSWSPREDDDL
jgi:hypothetical protein